MPFASAIVIDGFLLAGRTGLRLGSTQGVLGRHPIAHPHFKGGWAQLLFQMTAGSLLFRSHCGWCWLHLHWTCLEPLLSFPHVVGGLFCKPKTGFTATLHT